MGLKAIMDKAGGDASESSLVSGGKVDGERKASEVKVVAVDDEVAALVADYASFKQDEAELKMRAEVLKARALDLHEKHGIDDFKGSEGTVQVIHSAGPLNFDKKKALTFLSEEQAKECLKRGKGSTSVKFLPSK